MIARGIDAKAVRFAIALVGGASIGCGPANTTVDPAPLPDSTMADAAVDDVARDVTATDGFFDAYPPDLPLDVALDGDVGPHGSCFSDIAGALPCPPGTYCDWDGTGPPRCVTTSPSDLDASNNEPCGLITCVGDHQCWCAFDTTSFCECGIGGPLPPPDLPYSLEARRRIETTPAAASAAATLLT